MTSDATKPELEDASDKKANQTLLGLALIAFIAIAFIVLGKIGSGDSTERKLAANNEARIAQAELAMKERLKDPESVQWRDVYVSRFAEAAVCGQVNARNSFGGYTGFKQFIVVSGLNLAFLEGEVDGWSKIWIEYCSRHHD